MTEVEAEQEPLRILLVEDSQGDADLVLRQLRELGQPFEHCRVFSEDTLRAALAEFSPSVILSDFAMPGFSGQRALEIVLEQAPHLPVVFVSGAVGEELAIQAVQRGAVDYVLKNNLCRLPSAVRRALQLARDREQRTRMEQALQESEERFRSIVEASNDWIWEADGQTRNTYSNAAISRVLGYEVDEILGTPAFLHMLEEDRLLAMATVPGLVAAKQGWRRWPLRWRHRDGTVRVLESSADPILDGDGQVIGFRGVDQDITERLRQEEKIRELARLQAVLAYTSSAVLRGGTRASALEQACKVAVERGGFLAACISEPTSGGGVGMVGCYGNPRVIEEVAAIGRESAEVGDLDQQSPGVQALRRDIMLLSSDVATDDAIPAWIRARLQDVGVAAQAVVPLGTPPWGVLELHARDPRVFGTDEIGLFDRLSSEIDFAVDFIAKSERLQFLAYNNPVSGLPNRVAFHEQLGARLAEGPVTVAMLCVNRFGAINESRGRAFGDRVLQLAGNRLWSTVDDAVVAHLEADTFALAYPFRGTAGEECERLESLMQAFEAAPFTVCGEAMRIDLLGGLAFAPDHGAEPESIEHSAVAALLEADKRGLRIHVFDDELRGRASARLALEQELRTALELGQFELFYQPKFSAAHPRLMGAEALLRWRHPQRGLVSPAEFIAALEESALIVQVGRWVMAEALRTALSWRQSHPDFRIAVNVSARELRHSRFLDDCRAILEPHVDDQPIDIEVTESLLMEDITSSVKLLEGLRSLGCSIAIDDFGTGYSSLNYLTRLPVDTIKIDQSFIALLTQSPETMALVTNIIGLAHSLSFTVVAEGVEEEGQAHLLRLLRCDVLQGYYFGRPLPGAEFEARFLAS